MHFEVIDWIEIVIAQDWRIDSTIVNGDQHVAYCFMESTYKCTHNVFSSKEEGIKNITACTKQPETNILVDC